MAFCGQCVIVKRQQLTISEIKSHSQIIFLVSFQCLAHVGLLSMLIWANWWHWGITLVMYFLFSCMGASITYHRLLAHKSWNCNAGLRQVLICIAHMALVGSAIAWVAAHRQHHVHADQSKQDLHSPRHHPWWQVLFLAMLATPQVKYAKDLLQDPTCIWWHKHYFLVHGLVNIVFVLISLEFWVCGWLAPQALTWILGSALNTFNHVIGYRSHDCADHSCNNRFFGYLFWGEGWHNNHHANPRKYQFGEQWWEWDPAAKIISWIKNN